MKKYYPLLIVAFLLTIFAISNNVHLGAKLLFSIPLPDGPLGELALIFRAAERMFWPMHYLIIITAIYLIVRGFGKGPAIAILALTLAVQAVDTRATWGKMRKTFMVEPSAAWSTPFKDQFWEAASQKYTKVRQLCRPSAPQQREINAYAANHKMGTDYPRLARTSSTARAALYKSKDDCLKGHFAEDSLYIVNEHCAAIVAYNLDATTDLLAKIDGFFVVAPKWKKCADCPPVKNEISFGRLLPPMDINKTMRTNKKGPGLPYMGEGWGIPQSQGRSSISDKATIILPLSKNHPKKVVLHTNMSKFVRENRPSQRIDVSINNEYSTSFVMTPENQNSLEIEIPDSVFQAASFKNVIELEFSFPDAIRQVDFGISANTNKSALQIRSITLK